MKSILLIGLGRFGKHIAMELHNLGHQILAVDSTEERVDSVLPYVTERRSGTVRVSPSFLRSASGISMPASSPSVTIFRVL